MITQMLVPPPKYFVDKLVPKVKLTRKANFVGMFIIERGEEQITPMENEEALQILLQNCEDAYGFPPYEDIKEFLYIEMVWTYAKRNMRSSILRSGINRFL